MKKIISVFILACFYIPTHSQNLVPNPSFETITSCPNANGQIGLATPWNNPNGGSSTPDVMNSCFITGFPSFDIPLNTVGWQNARTGNSYAHIITDYSFSSSWTDLKEYIQVQFTSPLIAGQIYDVSFYISNSDNTQSSTNNIGAYISVLPPSSSNFNTLPYIPQINETSIISDTASWVLINDTYTAIGGEEYITIGNFFHYTQTNTLVTRPSATWGGAGYYIDDVSVTPMLPPPTGACDTLCGPNLAPNPGFENTTIDCSDTISEMFTNYSQVQSWFGTACKTCPGNGSTPDYYNSLCNGPASTNTCDASNGSVGFFTFAVSGANAREYVQAQLSSPLIAGTEYCVSIDVKTSSGSFAYKPSDGFGLWFNNQMIDIDIDNGGQQFLGPGSIVNATPQVENPIGNFIDTNCTTITNTFIATGTEQWVILGNFRDDSNTSFNTSCSFFNPCFGYLIVDNIAIRTTCNNPPQPVDLQINLNNDTICEGDCSTLMATIIGGTPPYTVTWDNSIPNGIGPHNVCPTNTTTYTAIVTDSLNEKDTTSITLYVNPTDTTTNNTTICGNDSLFVGGGWQNTTGLYYDTLQNFLSCDSILITNLTVIPKDTAAFTYPSGSYCLTDPDPLPTITGTTGGTFSIDNSGVINSSTGLIDINGSGVGAYVVTYITNGTCPDTATFNINIVTTTDATITQAGPFCENDPSVTLTAVDPGGNWTGTGITNATIGVFDPNTAGPGNHVITYTISGSCGDVDTMTIVVNPSDDASFSFSPTTFCDTDPNPLPTGIVTAGGTFTIDNSGTINGTTGEVNLSASGAGSYVITYITNGSCPDTSTFNITITTCATPTAAYTVSDSTVCDGECVTFTDNSTGATMWQWTFNGGTPSTASTQGPHTVCFSGPGIYSIELIASNSTGADTITSTVEVYANPTIDAGSDVTIELGQSVTLNATGSNGSYSWTPPTWLDCPTCSSTLATPEETVTYTVTVVDSNGCSASDEVTIIVDFEYVIWVPNIFSPNGDGQNDVAFVRGVGVESLNYVIYDRWGEKVFETTDLNIGWDGTFRGKPMNNGVFVYYLKATFLNGSETTKKGDITLIR